MYPTLLEKFVHGVDFGGARRSAMASASAKTPSSYIRAVLKQKVDDLKAKRSSQRPK